jgi:hypothetical protein
MPKHVGVMVFNATFYNMSVTSWWSVLLVEEIYPEKTTDLPQVTDKHNSVSGTSIRDSISQR